MATHSARASFDAAAMDQPDGGWRDAKKDAKRKTRNRLSLNLNLSMDFSPREFEARPRPSPPSQRYSVGTGAAAIGDMEKRPVGRPRSFQAVMEEGRLLQEKLAELARSENARLYSTPPPVGGRPTTPASASSYESTLEDLSIPRGMSPLSDNFEYQASPSVSTPWQRGPLLESPQITSSRPTASRPAHKRQHSFFVMSPDDFERRLVSPPGSAQSSQPRPRPRPLSLQGAPPLSWKLTAELMQLGLGRRGSQSTHDGDETADTVDAVDTVDTTDPFLMDDPQEPNPGTTLYDPDTANTLRELWTTLSHPDNLKAVLQTTDARMLPPREVIDAIRQMLPSLRSMLEFALQCLCAGVAASVVAVQMALIAVMVVAYVVGDFLVPRRLLQAVSNLRPKTRGELVARKIKRAHTKRKTK